MVDIDDATVTGWALAAKAGDRSAAAAFVRATQPQVQRFLAHLVSPREAEDLTQETYLRAMRSLPRFAARSSVRTWLYTIARRVAADHLRSAAARPRTAELVDWEGAADSVLAGTGGVGSAGRATAPVPGSSGAGSGGGTFGAGRFEERVVLRDLLTALVPERRLAFVATQVLGLSYAEAARVCGCPVGTVRSRVARAREDLVEALQDRGGARSEPRAARSQPAAAIPRTATR